jgi:hypothetical protein
MAEIALGPKGAFENGNVGSLTRRVAADKVVRAAPPSGGNPNRPENPGLPKGLNSPEREPGQAPKALLENR